MSASRFASEDIHVSYEIVAGTADDTDLVLRTGALTIPVGSDFEYIEIMTIDDTNVEDDETFVIRLLSVSSGSIIAATATGTIVDDDGVDDEEISVSMDDDTFTEGVYDIWTSGQWVLGTVRLSEAATSAVTVTLQPVSGTAVFGTDFGDVETTVQIPAGSTSGTFKLKVTDDLTAEPNESFQIQITNATGAVIGDGTGDFTIVDNDTRVIVNDQWFQEGLSPQQRFRVHSTRPMGPGESLEVTYELYEITAGPTNLHRADSNDVSFTTGSIVIGSGQDEAWIPVVIHDDTLNENLEHFRVRLVGRTGPGSIAEGTIQDNDDPNEHAPTNLNLSSTSFDEMEFAAFVGVLSAEDIDTGHEENMTYTLVAGEGSDHNHRFNINGDQLRLGPWLMDFESAPPQKVRIRAKDPTGLSTEAAFVLTINDVNEAPTDIILAPSEIAEFDGTYVGDLTALDDDANDTHTFTLLPNPGQGELFLESAGSIYARQPLNYEDPVHGSSYTLTVVALDSDGLTFTKEIQVTVGNRPPTGSAQTYTVPANQEVVGTFTASDPGGADLQFSVGNGAPFTIHKTGESTAEIRMLTGNVISGETYNFQVHVSDGNLTTPVDVSVAVRPHAESQSRTGLQLNSVDGIDLLIGNNNDNDDAYEQLSVEIVDEPGHGQLYEVQNGEYQWIPFGTFRGTDTFTFRLTRNGLQSDVATLTITTALLLPYLGFREGDSVPTVPPSRAEDEPGAIGDLNQVENPHAGYNQPTSTDPQFYRTVYNAVNIYLTEYLQHGLSEGVDTSGFTGDQLEYSSLIIEWVADHFFPSFTNRSVMEKELLLHFLANVGTPKSIPLDVFLYDVPEAREHFDTVVAAAMEMVGDLEFVGTVNLTSIESTLEQSSGSWAFGIGQYTTWGDVEVHGSLESDGSITYEFTYTYNFWDPYDWHPEKGDAYLLNLRSLWWVDPGLSIGDVLARFLANMHLHGNSKQFLMTGELATTVSWSNRDPVPQPPAP